MSVISNCHATIDLRRTGQGLRVRVVKHLHHGLFTPLLPPRRGRLKPLHRRLRLHDLRLFAVQGQTKGVQVVLHDILDSAGFGIAFTKHPHVIQPSVEWQANAAEQPIEGREIEVAQWCRCPEALWQAAQAELLPLAKHLSNVINHISAIRGIEEYLSQLGKPYAEKEAADVGLEDIAADAMDMLLYPGAKFVIGGSSDECLVGVPELLPISAYLLMGWQSSLDGGGKLVD